MPFRSDTQFLRHDSMLEEHDPLLNLFLTRKVSAVTLKDGNDLPVCFPASKAVNAELAEALDDKPAEIVRQAAHKVRNTPELARLIEVTHDDGLLEMRLRHAA